MSVARTSIDRSVIVGRLGAAGCVFADDEARMLIAAARGDAELADMVERRTAGLPLEHVVGWTEFCGLRIAVQPGVFVPRRRTEFLVRQAATLLRGEEDPDRGAYGASAGADSASRVVVDLCCGSGAVGAALAATVHRVELHAVDIDPVAARCARGNLAAIGGRVYEGDLYRPLPAALTGRVDVLVANVPYVPSAQLGLLPAEARLHEPAVALDGGADGLDVLRRVAAAAPPWLAPGGHLLVETSDRQAAAAVAAMARSVLAPRAVRCAELDVTVVIGTRPPGPELSVCRRTAASGHGGGGLRLRGLVGAAVAALARRDRQVVR